MLANARHGDRHAENELLELVYGELHRLASHYMWKERSGHTLQASALVNEAYLRLMGSVKDSDEDWESRGQFYAAAAQTMRRILIDYARGKKTVKREGGIRVDLEESRIVSDEQGSELLIIDEALTRLAEWDPRQSRIVELRFFGGLTVEETAKTLGISPKTVKRDWSVARAWLEGELRGRA